MSGQQTVLVIGGTSGMGRAVADQVAARGDLVVVSGRDEARARAVAATVGGGARGIAIDLTSAESIADAAIEVGAIDHLVLSAATIKYAPFRDLDVDDVREVFETKFWGYYQAVRAIVPLMPSHGSITIFSGVAVNRPGIGSAAVTSVNSALEGLTRSLAVELAPIRVNSVSPGIVDTEGWSFAGDDERKASFAEMGSTLPVGRVGRPAEVAATVLHLIDNGFATGANFHIDGGARLA